MHDTEKGSAGLSFTTLRDFIEQLQPKTWDEYDLERWFEWPPDVFALTSVIFSYTGAYRRAISPPDGVEWPEPGWALAAKRIGAAWRRSVATCKASKPLRLPAEVCARIEVLRENESLKVDSLYDSDSTHPNPDGKPWAVCRALLELHALADEAMRGVGLVYSPRTNFLQGAPRVESVEHPENGDSSSAGETSDVYAHSAFFYLQANCLLTLRGSLSRIPKYRGIVLPKARTSQVGLSLRSLSNHLTFHQTEVDVAWRAFPWIQFDENTVNIMVVPWPYEVHGTSFRRLHHPRTAAELGQHRYFHYEPSVKPRLPVKDIVSRIRAAQEEVRRVHLLVFPEMALRESEFRALREALAEKLSPSQMPMIIAGVSNALRDSDDRDSPEEPSRQVQRHLRVPRGGAGYNRVFLSIYYAQRWFHLEQNKHHRWKVDQRQVTQYGLAAALPAGNRAWWEAIHIPRRRFSVLAANSWLSISPLICEDLARLDPVAELIRGIGPTLCTALLLDGPQLPARWPARYASVLADDPGTSVLTLTALGMSKRSMPPLEMTADERSKAKTNTGVVGLWRDAERGFHRIRVEPQETENVPRILTISASWVTESTIDGRTESGNSAVFTHQATQATKRLEEEGEKEGESEKPSSPEPPVGEEDNPIGRGHDSKISEARSLNITELTLYTYYVDALLDAREIPASNLQDWFHQAVSMNEEAAQAARRVDEEDRLSSVDQDLVRIICGSIRTRDSVPKGIPSAQLILAIQEVTDLVAKAEIPSEETGKDRYQEDRRQEYWEALVGEAERSLKAVMDDFDVSCEDPDDDFWKTLCEVREEGLSAWTELPSGRPTDKAQENGREPLSLLSVGRIQVSVPLSVLWGVHVRLATRRRYGTLGSEEAKLMRKVENLLEGEADAKLDYHSKYRRWVPACRDWESRPARGTG